MVPGLQRQRRASAWLEQGGVYVVANIRGGGEFGPDVAQGRAARPNRQRAYDDFIAVAEDLVARKVTTPAHLGIQGGSNGGLLVGNMLTRRPELFGAVVCQVPLLDMRRYHMLLAGASWMAEYGDPDEPDGMGVHPEVLAVSERRRRREVPADAVHDLDPRRPRASRARAQDGGADAGVGARRPLLREHRRRPRGRGQQPAASAHARARLHVSLAKSALTMGPLTGLRILEFEAIGPVPFCGMLLADMGADVLLVDRAQRLAASASDATAGTTS